jgi:membrane protease subunit (stomatin/prohibitin family)
MRCTICVPPSGMADLKLGARVLVQESQAAVFFRNGKALDVMQPGSHTLSTENVPLISKLFNLVYQDNPFQASVYFVSMKPVRNLGWGTKEPVTLRDAEFGLVRARAFGKFSVRVTDAQMFVQTVVGTEGRQDADDIEHWFKSVILSAFTGVLASLMQGKSVLDLQARQQDISAAVKAKTTDDFGKYGVELVDYILESINLPEAVQKRIDDLSSMRAVEYGGRSMGQFMQYQAANALEKAGEGGNPGLNAGMSVGMMGMVPGMMGPAFGAVGYGQPGMMPGVAMVPGMGAPGMAPPPLPGAAPPISYFAAIGGQQAGPFDANGLRAQAAQGHVTAATLVWKPGMASWTKAGDVPEVAMLIGPPPLPTAGPPPLPTGAGPPPIPPS